MYKKAVEAFTAHFSIFLAFALLSTLLEELDLGTSFLGVKLLVSALLAFYCHRMILLGDAFGWEELVAKKSDQRETPKLWPFIWRIFVSTALFIALTTIIYLQLRAFFASRIPEPDVLAFGFLVSAVVALPLFGVGLALFGTVFPAAAINEDASIGRAFERGKARFWITLWRLFLGSFCFSAVAIAAYVWGANQLGAVTADDGGLYYVFSFFATLLGSFSTLLAATALSLAYQEAEAYPPKH